MKALCWHGKHDIRYETVPDPAIEHPRDAIIKTTCCAICGSDLHFYDGFMPGMKSGDIVGHEFMGEVVEVGAENKKLKVGDRVVVPFTICCGECEQCRRGNFSVCERTNRKKNLGDLTFGHSTAGLFGYTHITGGYAGGQAEYVRVPYADVAPVKIPEGLTDEQVLFLGDIFPTGWQAAAQCDIQPTDTVCVWGAGPVGQFAIRSAIMLGAEQVICIDNVPERLDMARAGGAITIDFDEESVLDRLQELTGGKGPDKCIEAGRHGGAFAALDRLDDRPRQAVGDDRERPAARAARDDVRLPAGRVLSVAGVYGGMVDKIPFGAVMNKGLTIRTGQTHVNRWTDDLLQRIGDGQIDPSFVITHNAPLEDGPAMYRTFRDKEDGCIKVVLKP
jgi:threonine dehydrogenase-like Zn-dependent dehydrogenase